MKKQWIFPNCIEKDTSLPGVHNAVAGLLAMRGISSAAEAEEFLAEKPRLAHDPFLMKDLKEAARLVLEAVLGGVQYYYPISLPELKQNTRYHVTLNIVRPGATSPEQDMDKYAVSFKINVEEWKGPENITETI